MDLSSIFRGRLQPKTSIDFSSLQERLQAGLSSTVKINLAPYEAVLIAMNNVEKSAEYVVQLSTDMKTESDHVFVALQQRDVVKLESCLGEVNGITKQLMQLLEVGLLHLRSALFEPRLRSLADAAFEDTYELTEEDIANFDSCSPHMTAVLGGVQSLLMPFREWLSSDNFSRVVVATAEVVTMLLERGALQCRFNRLGGLQFDRDIRALLNHVSALTQWSVRDKFTRLVQISTILNLDKVAEFTEYWGVGAQITWRLSPAEVRRVMALRTDFRGEEISKLRL